MSIHQVYEKLTDDERNAVDGAFDAAWRVLQQEGYETAMDDRAEELVEAIAKYLVESKNK